MGNGVVVVNAGTTDVDITDNKFNTGVTLIALPATITNAAILVFNPTPQTTDATVSGNAIKRFRYGVWFTNVEGSNQFIFDNTMNFQQLTTNATGGLTHYGIRLQGCDNTVVDENKIGKPGINPILAVADEIRGISVENSTDCQISENILTKMGTGVWCEDNLFGSEIVCNDMKKCYDGIWFENTLIGDHIPTGIGQQNEWLNHAGPFRMAGEIDVPGGIKFWYNPGATFFPFPNLVAGLGGFTPGYPDASFDPTYDYCGTLFSPGPVEMRESNIGRIARMELNFATNVSENLWLTCNYAYRELEKDSTWLNLGTPDDGDYQGFHNMIDAGNTGTLEQVKNMAAAGDIPGALTMNNSIADTCMMDYNQKMVNDIYLRNWAIGEYEYVSSDSSLLWNVAYGDPRFDGLSVYGARVMLFTDVEAPTYHSMMIENDATQQQTTELTDVVRVYPNPTTGNVTFVVGEKEGSTLLLQVFDIAGKLQYEQQTVNNNMLYAELSQLDNGIYLYRIQLDNEVIATDRLIISK